jgi:hypothetical protein
MRWLWQGVFSMEIPEGWRVFESGDLIEIIPPQPVGAAHISVLKRARSGHVGHGEASELVSNFAHKQGAEPGALSEETEESQQIARAEFESTDQEGKLYWDVEAHVWDERGLVCSFCHDGLNNGIRRVTLEMFRSIAPVMATQGPSVH